MVSVFDALDPGERGAVLADLLAERPDLREDVERLAVARLAAVSVEEVAGDVEWELESIELQDLAGRAGRQPGRGLADWVASEACEAGVPLPPEAIQEGCPDWLRLAQ